MTCLTCSMRGYLLSEGNHKCKGSQSDCTHCQGEELHSSTSSLVWELLAKDHCHHLHWHERRLHRYQHVLLQSTHGAAE